MFLHATIPQLPACCVLVSTASPSLCSLWHDVLWLSPSHPVTNVDGLSLMPVTSPLSESASCKIFSLHLLSANEVHHPIKPHLRSSHKMSQLQQYFITIPLDRHRSKSALSRHLKCTKCQLYFQETSIQTPQTHPMSAVFSGNAYPLLSAGHLKYSSKNKYDVLSGGASRCCEIWYLYVWEWAIESAVCSVG